MTRVRIFTPENPLAEFVSAPGGLPFEDLVGAAETRLQTLGPMLAESVLEHVRAIMALQDVGEEAMFGAAREVARHAANIAEVAAVAGLEAVGEVARGICAMIESLLLLGVWHSEALELHVTSLALMISRPPEPAEVTAMLERLRTMRRAIGVVE